METNNWKDIWDSRVNKVNKSGLSDLDYLLTLDGSRNGKTTQIELEVWTNYVKDIVDNLRIRSGQSVYEVGVGAGAFLFTMNKLVKNLRLGGLDYSPNLIEIVKSYIKGYFGVYEAKDIDKHLIVNVDHMTSRGVFFYFPDESYAIDVVKKMIQKANKTVSILGVNDLEFKSESLDSRNKLYGNGYKDTYEGLNHLYLSKMTFIKIAEQFNLKIEITEVPEYISKSTKRFNVVYRLS